MALEGEGTRGLVERHLLDDAVEPGILAEWIEPRVDANGDQLEHSFLASFAQPLERDVALAERRVYGREFEWGHVTVSRQRLQLSQFTRRLVTPSCERVNPSQRAMHARAERGQRYGALERGQRFFQIAQLFLNCLLYTSELPTSDL